MCRCRPRRPQTLRVAQDVNDRLSPVPLLTVALGKQPSKMSKADIARAKKVRDRMNIANKRAAQRTAGSGQSNGVFGLKIERLLLLWLSHIHSVG